jgi:leucyl aminopeptidase
MTTSIDVNLIDYDMGALDKGYDRISIFISDPKKLSKIVQLVDKKTKGAVKRAITTKNFAEKCDGSVFSLTFPGELAADYLDIVKLSKPEQTNIARKAGVNLAKKSKGHNTLICYDNDDFIGEFIKGFLLRHYNFSIYKSEKNTNSTSVRVMLKSPKAFEKPLLEIRAIVDGVFFTRDLVNEPANILNTNEFSNRLKKLSSLGVEVEILEEKKLAELGMNALLGVGQGSANPSKVVVMSWKGASENINPLALVGKGVVFDTGGISLKPAGGMEDMTMDMGGAGVVAGTMLSLAKRKAKANVVGLVGLVENMPSSTAQRPGDIVKSMKGDTVEVINTDAEGRLVLSDLLWYTQERFQPTGIIDLATLTGAIIVALGHENAGVFSNDDEFCNSFLKVANQENEGAWRMPLGPSYDKKLKSRLADMKNVGGRDAGAITAAQFIQRFIKKDMPWIHIDIAGAAHTKSESTFAPAGATGWGVMSLNRLVSEKYENIK